MDWALEDLCAAATDGEKSALGSVGIAQGAQYQMHEQLLRTWGDSNAFMGAAHLIGPMRLGTALKAPGINLNMWSA